jgi:hypothetical protein
MSLPLTEGIPRILRAVVIEEEVAKEGHEGSFQEQGEKRKPLGLPGAAVRTERFSSALCCGQRGSRQEPDSVGFLGWVGMIREAFGLFDFAAWTGRST